MTWWALDVRTAPASHDAVASWLVSKTGQAVEERDDGTLVTFAPDEGTADALIAELGAASGGADMTTERRKVEPVDWSVRWREGLGARRIGRLMVTRNGRLVGIVALKDLMRLFALRMDLEGDVDDAPDHDRPVSPRRR